MSDPRAAVETRIPLLELIDGLSDPAAFGVEGEVEVVQTHVSAVFLAGERAYKVKKPLQLWGFLDYGSFETRRGWCEVEVALNRRLAPSIYLGVAPVQRRSDGGLVVGRPGATGKDVVEHAVVMVRLPLGVTFKERLAAGLLDEADIDEAARLLASFHAAHRLAPEDAALARPGSFGAVVRQNFLSTREDVPNLFPSVVHEGLARRMAGHLRGARGMLRRRVNEGRAVNGHGDVRLEHVVRYEGAVHAIDCVEFSELVRHVDPLCDMAFLSMDLQVRGRGDLARRLEATYVEAAGESPDVVEALMPIFRSYRAHVRAKVDALTWRSPEVDEAVRTAKALGACRYLALAWTYARAGATPPIVMLRGASGTGKSVLASQLAPWLDGVIVRSDRVRKELAGIGATVRVSGDQRQALYSSEMSERTYEAVLEQGLASVRGGRAALLDATYLQQGARTRVLEAARRIGAPCAILDVTCPPDEVRARLRRREAENADVSDAGVAVYEAQIREAEGLTESEPGLAVTHAAGDAPEHTVLRLLEVLEASA